MFIPSGVEKPGFPTPDTNVKIGCWSRGWGKPGFPHPPTRWEGLGGRSPPKNKLMFIAALFGAAA